MFFVSIFPTGGQAAVWISGSVTCGQPAALTTPPRQHTPKCLYPVTQGFGIFWIILTLVLILLISSDSSSVPDTSSYHGNFCRKEMFIHFITSITSTLYIVFTTVGWLFFFFFFFAFYMSQSSLILFDLIHQVMKHYCFYIKLGQQEDTS